MMDNKAIEQIRQAAFECRHELDLLKTALRCNYPDVWREIEQNLYDETKLCKA